MYTKSKLAVLILSALVVFYAALVMFYGNVVAQGSGAYKEIAVFVDVLNKISNDYVDSPDLQKVLAGAMRGMVEALDPYGGYFDKETIEALDRRLKEFKGDIGVKLSKRPEIVYVVSTIPGSPSQRAGIRPGDYIVSVDEAATFSMHLREVEGALRGETGTTVKLGVLRGSQAQPIEITITREEVVYPEISQRILAEDVGYIQPHFLGVESANRFKAKLKTLTTAGAAKILLDLRYVAGGEIDQALEIANFFIGEGLLAYTEGKQRPRKDYRAARANHICDLPLVVLVNSATSDAGEILAGAIQDRTRGRLVGEKTFGSASQQERVELRDGSLLLLTTSRFFTPDGTAIQSETGRGNGISPDVVAPADKVKSDLILQNYLDNRNEDGEENFRQLMHKIDSLQLEKALELLASGEVAAQKAA